jgi:uncharacterized repeat protein (TIGR01451 family)
MKSFAVNLRLLALVAGLCCVMGVGTAEAQAPTASLSPSSLTFGVPTGSTVSAPETVTFAVTGAGSVTLGTVNSSNADFAIATDNCTGMTVTAPGSCTVSVTFTPTSAAGTLETGILNFPTTANGTPTVPLSGAAGAIKLFDPINVAASNPHASLNNLFAFKSETLSVSCAGSPTATLSSSPDGLGNVVVDNFLSLNTTGATQPTPITTGNLVGNVCPAGGPADQGQNDCFTSAYQNAASGGGLDGTNPDTFANASNGVLSGGAAGGVPAINVNAQFSGNTTSATVTLLDGGGEVASSSLFLVTSCSSGGVQTGGTITANPLNPNQPGSLTPDFPFNTTSGKHITFSTNFLSANTFDGVTTPSTGDTGLNQTQFAALVANSSAAPAVCIRLSGEVASDGVTPLCKAFTITCTDSSGTSAGANCPQSAARTLLFETKLDSPDPIPAFAPGTGPGLLMGTDDWVANAAPCVTFGPNDGAVSNQLCPQNPLTEFKGTGDPISGSTPRGVNSTFIPVFNMPLPQTTPAVVGQNGAGWVNNPNVVVNFVSNPASYTGTGGNGFVAAPILSLTYGIAPASNPVPDPTFPVTGDVVNTNSVACPAAPTPSALPYASTATFNNLADGHYTLHYFATDCASTEELAFNPNSSPSVNWASFRTVAINVDTTKPTVGPITFTPPSSGNIFAVGEPVKVTFSCADTLSGVASCVGTSSAPGSSPIQGSPSGGTFTFSTLTATSGPQTFTVTAKDNAGNTLTSAPVTYQVVGSSDLALLDIASFTVKTGKNLTYNVAVLNLGPSVADDVVVTDTLPANTSFVSAGFGTVTCTLSGCSDIAGSGTACSLSGNTVTCNIPTVGLLLKSWTGALIKVTVKVNATAGTTLKDTASVTAANTDPHTGNNSATAQTRVTN